MKNLYPRVEPFKVEHFPVGSGHELYLEQYGNPKGQPVIFIHGGPGGVIKQKNSQYFNTKKYRLIQFEQRGCGRSKYKDLLKDNTTWDTVKDIEKIREYLKIKKWHVFGGSWGSTLALAYGETYPENIISMHLRGIYFGSLAEDDWLFLDGANRFYPDKYIALQKILEGIPRDKQLQYLYDKVVLAEDKISYPVAKAMDDWEGAIMKLIPLEVDSSSPLKEREYITPMKVMMHYVINGCFLEKNQLIKNIKKLKNIPAVIIHGRYDIVCPFINAWRLHQAWPKADFEIVQDAGHHHSDPGNQQKILEYTDKFLKLTSARKV